MKFDSELTKENIEAAKRKIKELGIEYSLPEESELSISSIIRKTHECLLPYLQSESAPCSLDFFDTKEIYPFPEMCMRQLGCLCTDLDGQPSPLTIPSIIMNDIVMQCYHEIRSSLEQNNEYSIYGAMRSKLHIENTKYERPSELKNAGQKLKTLSDSLNINFLKGENTQFLSQYKLVIDTLLAADTTDIRRIFNINVELINRDKREDISNSLTRLIKLRNQKGNISNKVEKTYYYYITESIMPINLVYNLIYLICQAEIKLELDLFDDKIWGTCNFLPNIFSRTYLLHYAFEHLSVINYSYDYVEMSHFSNGGISIPIPKSNKYDHFNKWKKQYETFVVYLSLFVIPLYTWTFLCILLDSLCQSDNSTLNSDLLTMAKKLLEKYIDENHEQILEPLNQEIPDNFLFHGRTERTGMISPFFPRFDSELHFIHRLTLEHSKPTSLTRTVNNFNKILTKHKDGFREDLLAYIDGKKEPIVVDHPPEPLLANKKEKEIIRYLLQLLGDKYKNCENVTSLLEQICKDSDQYLNMMSILGTKTALPWIQSPVKDKNDSSDGHSKYDVRSHTISSEAFKAFKKGNVSPCKLYSLNSYLDPFSDYMNSLQ